MNIRYFLCKKKNKLIWNRGNSAKKRGIRLKKSFLRPTLLFLLLITVPFVSCAPRETAAADADTETEQAQEYIKWIDFTVPCEALSAALRLDVETHASERPTGMVELLSLYASRTGGNFDDFRKDDLQKLSAALQTGKAPEELTKNLKLYRYYLEAYGAILGGAVGNYTEVRTLSDGTEERNERYGLRLFSPLAAGFAYSDYDDFGAARSYGYKRNHLGHDLLGSVGTPVIAVESGTVEHLGWNQYGGWRVGIRSLDGKRYYYYAHLRKNAPFAKDLYEGKYVNAGEVIGYLGMTGYSVKENVNGINTPHLHYGLQIIFDESQIDGWNQIWIDLYDFTSFLAQNRAATVSGENGRRVSAIRYLYPEMPD